MGLEAVAAKETVRRVVLNTMAGTTPRVPAAHVPELRRAMHSATRAVAYRGIMEVGRDPATAPAAAVVVVAALAEAPPDAATLEGLRGFQATLPAPWADAVRKALAGYSDGAPSHNPPAPSDAPRAAPAVRSKRAALVESLVTGAAPLQAPGPAAPRRRAVPKERDAVAQRRAGAAICVPRPLPLKLPRRHDYTEQVPLRVSGGFFDTQVLQVLRSYMAGYATNPVVRHASAILVKLICDAYAERLPFLRFGYLREVSCAFLAPLKSLVRGEYLCVKCHVFDVLLNLAAQVQVIDSAALYPGATALLHEEVMWMAREVLTFQLLAAESDPRVWTAALKLVLCTMEPAEVAQLHPGVLRALLHLPGLAAAHPAAFTVLAVAAAAALARPDNGAVLAHLGGTHGLAAAYGAAPTEEAAAALFRALCAAGRCVPADADADGVFESCRAVNLPWVLRIAAVGPVPRHIFNELPQAVAVDLEAHADGVRVLLRRFLDLAASLLRQSLPAHLSCLTPSLAADAVAALPALLSDGDAASRVTAVRLAVEALRVEWADAPTGGATPLTAAVLREVVASRNPRLYSGGADIIARCVRCLDPPLLQHHGAALLQAALRCEAGAALSAPAVLRLYRAVVERLVGSVLVVGDPSSAVHDDVTAAVLAGAAVGNVGTVGGATTLWALYRALRRCARTVSLDASAEARLALLFLLAEHGAADTATWGEAMDDPSPDCAVAAAQQYVRCGGASRLDTYDAGDPEAAPKDVFSVAVAIRDGGAAAP